MLRQPPGNRKPIHLILLFAYPILWLGRPMRKLKLYALHATLLATLTLQGLSDAPLRVLIIDGRNNHDWISTSQALRATLEHTGRFSIEVATAPQPTSPRGLRRPRTDDPARLQQFEGAQKTFKELTAPLQQSLNERWQDWRPNFAAADVALLNYNGPTWPEAAQNALIDYVRAGGGLVLIHASNNAFGNWDAFNQMIGLGWRKAGFGNALKVKPDTGKPFVGCADCNSGHGAKHPFKVTVRQPDHPIMHDLPTAWLHGTDELYHNMRGPAKNLQVLSSAFSDPQKGGTGEHEPITWEVRYGKGRVVVTTLGHFWRGQDWWDSLYCVGFQTILARAAEYAASGKVTIPIPKRFPTAEKTSVLPPSKVDWHPRNTHKSAARTSAIEKKKRNPYGVLTPEEEATTFQLPPGYVAELIAAEPDVQEPVLTVWDGDGAMYVAEMRSYMQDEAGTGTKTLRNGRIKRLTDGNGDGIMDRVTVFADGLNLPRAILPLDDRIAVRETDSTDVWGFRDTDGDGVADEKKLLFRGKSIDATRSVEHQDSGLIWNLDNHIYISYNSERYRFTDGNWQVEKQPGHWTQWGLDHDDTGRLYWIANSEPLKAVQFHPKYLNIVRRLSKASFNGAPVSLGTPYPVEFMQSQSTCLLNDRGGEAGSPRSFTSACGQCVFRGDRLPATDRGAYFFCDPTIHVVRRAAIERDNGKIMLRKTDPPGKEFLLSNDINCRFVNTATGPDGCLYVTDMYRGIIQDAPWLSPGPREFIRKAGLNKNIQRGRIWRIRQADHQPGDAPRMQKESTVELCRHLENANGWWRDTAQRMIILRPDRDSVVPILEGMARYTENPLGRLHALWTLEGLGRASNDVLQDLTRDHDARVRAAVIQIAETGLPASLSLLKPLASDRDARVAEQLIFTLGTIDDAEAETMIQAAARRHLRDRGVTLATAISLWGKKELPLVDELKSGEAFQKLPKSERSSVGVQWAAALSAWDRGLVYPKDMPDGQRRRLRSGEQLYFHHCTACHGQDGTGMQTPGTDHLLAPPLKGSPRVQGEPHQLIPILLNGLIGPLDGKNYQAGYMAPATALGISRDDRLAELLSYIRFAWDQEGSEIDKEQVKTLRRKYSDRKTPWTQSELEKLHAEKK